MPTKKKPTTAEWLYKSRLEYLRAYWEAEAQMREAAETLAWAQFNLTFVDIDIDAIRGKSLAEALQAVPRPNVKGSK